MRKLIEIAAADPNQGIQIHIGSRLRCVRFASDDGDGHPAKEEDEAPVPSHVFVAVSP